MTDDELAEAFLGLVGTGEFDRILKQLRNKWDGTMSRDVVRDAVSEAATEVVRRAKSGQEITNLPGLLRTVADRTLIKWRKSAEDTERAEDVLKARAEHPDSWQHDEERAARVEAAAGFVRTLVPKVDNENYQATLLAMLDAAEHGYQLEPKDLAEQMGCTPNTASKWLERAPRRLLPILREEGFDSLDAFVGRPLPINDETDEEELNDD